jgi:hypothetical protein
MYAIVSRNRLLSLAEGLELDSSGFDAMVDAVAEMREGLQAEALSLSVADKLHVLKSLTRAKVRALRAGREDGYRTFRALEAISGDLVQLL